MKAAAINRWFLRCSDCCAVVAVDKDPMEPAYWQGVELGLQFRGDTQPKCDCGGKMFSMGRVTGNRMIREDLRCPCDSRCTNAAGPNCDCVCQGSNHGTGKMVCVRVDEGGVPTLLGGSKERALELREAEDAAAKRIEDLPFGSEILAGKWVGDRDAWERVNAAQRRLRGVRTFKTHTKRLAELAKVAASYNSNLSLPQSFTAARTVQP